MPLFRFFENLVEPFPPDAPQTPPDTLLAFIWHYTRPVWPHVALMSVLAALVAIGEVVLFGFLGNIVDWLSETDRAGFFDREGAKLIGMALLLLVGLPLLNLVFHLLLHQTILGNQPMIGRWWMHRYLLGQSMNFFANEFAGRVATKLMQTALAVRETVIKITDVLVYVLVYFFAFLVLLASADWRMALPLVGWIVIYSGLMAVFIPRLKEISRAQADARSIMTGRVVDSYTNITTVKLFSHAGREAAYAKDGMGDFLTTVHRQMRLVTVLQMLVHVNNALMIFSVAATGIYLWLGGAVTAGVFAIAIALVLRLQGMSQWIMWEISALFENLGVVIDGMGMLSKSHEVVDREDAGILEVKKGKIQFDGLTFNYGKSGDSERVIGNFSLVIKPGEKIGLVGRSGAGKTTLTNLLLRFYDLEKGMITIDGMDISTVTQDSLRENIGVVTQDTSLLHRSIRDNIAYGKPDASEEQILDAARQARAMEFIAGLEDQKGRKGLDAHVGERGVKLSGGQRQRIAIARVFLKDAPILILDEATSALDSEVEAAIQESLFDLMKGKTVIAIAHRLSTIASLDKLVVMDKGKIVETGTHEGLHKSGGIYAELWQRQSGGFLGIDQDVRAAE